MKSGSSLDRKSVIFAWLCGMNKAVLCFVLFLCMLFSTETKAQQWYQMHVGYAGATWSFPYNFGDVGHLDFDESGNVRLHSVADVNKVYPFATLAEGDYHSVLDSITFSDDLTEWGKDKYQVFGIYITIDNPSEWTDDKVDAKEWVNCYISIDASGQYPDLSMSGKIRGRGNSTLLWYDKKPYRIKFDSSSKLLGIKKNKDWVLLANWRDVTKCMNTFCFQAADIMGLPFTTPVRYAELFINGEYRGLYQIAEQVEVGGNRVNIDEEKGLLMTLDLDDGPDLDPTGTQNFWSKVFRMPVAIKSPKNLTKDQVDSVRNEFAVLENAIKVYNYDIVDSLMDLKSYIAMIQLQELAYNVELSAPRSVFFFRNKGGKWTFGPAWDWDAGFDFSWSDMYTGHTYFGNPRKSLLGSDPFKRNGNYTVSHFFTDMFGSRRFVSQYKAQWMSYCDTLVSKSWEITDKYLAGINSEQMYIDAKGRSKTTSPMIRETDRWPVPGFGHATEVGKMKKWLDERMAYLNPLIDGIPEGGDDTTIPADQPDKFTVAGTIDKAYNLDLSGGYSQSVKVKVSKSEIASILKVQENEIIDNQIALVPLNADGSEGNNTAAGTYGAWFDSDGNTTNFNSGSPFIYLESNDLYTWSCGCHPWYAYACTASPLTMQYRFTSTNAAINGRAVNVQVVFTIESGGGWWW